MTTLRLQADRSLLRSRSSSVRYLLATITAPIAPRRDNRLPVNVSLVLDRSGSMQGESKFPLAIEAVKQSLALLTPDDHFNLVVFDEHVDVLARSTRATPDAKQRALRALRQVAPRGSTDLFAGWMNGCGELAEALTPDSITRALLITDGQANHGETNREVLAHHAAELHRRGITTSTFGVGADFDERLLRDMAHEGGGNSYFIRSSDQILDLVTSELGEALEVVVPRATLTLHLPRGAEARVVNRFRSERTEGRTALAIELGDLVSGQQLDVVIRVRFPLGELGDRVAVRGTMNGVGEDLFEDGQVVEFLYASHAENDVQVRNREVDREVARVYVACARSEATEANRVGDYDRARRALVETSRHIRDYAGDDSELLELARIIREEMPQYTERVMEPMALKMAFYGAETYAKGRSPEGKARRG